MPTLPIPDAPTLRSSIPAPPMLDDTIAAIATAPGRAGLAVVRVSGPGSDRVRAALGIPALEPRRATLARVAHPEDGRALDRALATYFAAPASFTGEDVLELSCHGGELVPALVLDAALAAGARPAERGEFTRRAFLNGKLDLVQAEALLDLVEARSEAAGTAALFQLEGGLSRRVADLRERLVELRAMLMYEIDFPEEDEGPIPPERVLAVADGLADELGALLRDAPEGELLREGVLTVIAGRPNVGKSSLFNALLGQERAIVTEHAGTTRDAIEAVVSVEGYPFRLVDTAGLRDSAHPVEGRGIEVARRYLDRADLVLFCSPAGRDLREAERDFLAAVRDRAVVLVRTKADLASGRPPVPPAGAGGGLSPERAGTAGAAGPGEGDGPSPVTVSTTVEDAGGDRGLARLREAMLEVGYSGLRRADGAPLLTRRRQTRAVRRSLEEVRAFLEARRGGIPPEIAVTHLLGAQVALEDLLGIVETEEVMDALFSRFCIGK